MPATNASSSSTDAVAKNGTVPAAGAGTTRSDASLALTVASAYQTQSDQAAALVRQFFDLRDKVRNDDSQIRTLRRSLAFQETTLNDLAQQRKGLQQVNGGMDPVTKLAVLDEITEGESNCHRVMTQLKRQLESLEPSHAQDANQLVRYHAHARRAFQHAQNILQHYRDPIPQRATLQPGRLGNRLVLNMVASQTGLDRFYGRNLPRSMGRQCPLGTQWENRQSLVMTRLSRATTINTHMAYPVYCLRFDRTGRYFITGADDYLVKVFCLGPYVVKGGRGVERASYMRGAVLVTTLRGHAGVINDIEVSSDNCFLATASEDGDCRIWGLHDGCPIAILRGHTGGANMVGWETRHDFGGGLLLHLFVWTASLTLSC